MTELLIRLYRYFKSHATVFWGTMILWFAIFGYLASQIHLEEDINKLMPSSRNDDGSVKLAFADLKIKDKVYVLFHNKKGADTEATAEACDAFMDSLASVAHVGQKGSGIQNLFYRITDEDMGSAIEYLEDHIPAYIDTTTYSAIDSLLAPALLDRQMEQNANDMEGTLGQAYPELIELDPIGLRNVLGRQMGLGGQGKGSYSIVDSHLFVRDSTLCVAFITPAYSATNTGQGSAMFEQLNTLIKKFQKTHPDIEILYHGTPASGYYNSTTIKRDLSTTVLGSLIVVLVFLVLCLRHRDTLPLLLLPVVFGTLFGLAMMYLIKGEFSLLALGIGAVILGVAMSYVLHVLVHFNYVNDAEQMLRDEAKPILLGCITTIGSFLGLIFVRTDLLKDFGLFASFAILATTLFSLTYLPPLLRERMKSRWSLLSAIEKLSAYRPEQNRPLIWTVSVVAIIASAVALCMGNHFDADMHNLGYQAEEVSRSETLLRQKTFTGDKEKYFASEGATMEEAIRNFGILRHKLDSLKALGLVKSYTPTDRILVSEKAQQERIDAWHRYWTPARLQKARTLVAQAADRAGFESDAFDAFFEMAQRDYEPDKIYDSDAIPEGYLSTLMERTYSGKYLCYTNVRCANDTVHSQQSDYNRICTAIASNPNLMVLDTYFYTQSTLLQMNSDFNVLQWISMAFVLLVLLLSYRFRLRPTLISFLPILLSWLIVLGMMDIFGMSFNLISIIISTFIFGIGIDYSIFVMSGLMNEADGRNILSYHKTAIFLSAIILIITVSSMLIAQHPAIRSVGFSTLVGLVSAVLLSYILEPALYNRFMKKR